ncbi:hypothetical protein GM658_24465 [Pseudoduganella eburnea]|uniref:Uncharacterized protein n=1 Tax=Massilia eburnea TaxID=1776165 RepID=A0A6L6QNH9_9BURK|nr:hypothetical protein [Massilia eburnea]MTW13770.1 hypothetical protein [Massilia eburnea]
MRAYTDTGGGQVGASWDIQMQEDATMVSKEKINPMAPDSLKGRAPGVEPGNEQRSSVAQQQAKAGVGERGGEASQQTGWAARQSAERMRERAGGGSGMQQDQHAGAQESATGPAGKRQTDEARPKLSRARRADK